MVLKTNPSSFTSREESEVGGTSEEKLGGTSEEKSVSNDAKVSHVTASVCKLERALLPGLFSKRHTRSLFTTCGTWIE